VGAPARRSRHPAARHEAPSTDPDAHAYSPVVSARTGLGPLDVAILDAVDLLDVGEPVRCSDVLAAVRTLEGIGPGTTWPMLVDLGVPWRRHLPLVELYGDAGSVTGAPPADAEHVEVRLAAPGALALAAERGEVGPVPFGLVEGSWATGGPVPPFDPAAVVGALLAGASDAGPPALPGGGNVEGDVEGLLSGAAVRLTVGCTIRPEGGNLVITEIPLGVPGGQVFESVVARAMRFTESADGRRGVPVRRRGSPVVGVYDETTPRDGVRFLVKLADGADLLLARDWLRDVWPVTVEVDAHLPAPMAERLRAWERGDGSGLRGVRDLLVT
jgi:hypothetical protein